MNIYISTDKKIKNSQNAPFPPPPSPNTGIFTKRINETILETNKLSEAHTSVSYIYNSTRVLYCSNYFYITCGIYISQLQKNHTSKSLCLAAAAAAAPSSAFSCDPSEKGSILMICIYIYSVYISVVTVQATDFQDRAVS